MRNSRFAMTLRNQSNCQLVHIDLGLALMLSCVFAVSATADAVALIAEHMSDVPLASRSSNDIESGVLLKESCGRCGSNQSL